MSLHWNQPETDEDGGVLDSASECEARGNDAETCDCGGVRYYGGWCFRCGKGPDSGLSLVTLLGPGMNETRLREGCRLVAMAQEDPVEEKNEKREESDRRRRSVKPKPAKKKPRPKRGGWDEKEGRWKW